MNPNKAVEDLWEHSLSKHTGNVSVAGMVLGAVGVAGLLVTAAVAPNALKLLYSIPGRKHHASDKNYIDKTVKKLFNQGLIRSVRHEGVLFYQLTDRGELQLAKLKLAMGILEKPKYWDGKWRIITYDISEKRRARRILLLRALAEAGFYHLQDSVWVYPYPCRELHLLLKFHFALGKEVLYIEGAEIELEPKLLKHFDLHRIR